MDKLCLNTYLKVIIEIQTALSIFSALKSLFYKTVVIFLFEINVLY